MPINVLRIVPNLKIDAPGEVAAFYRDLFDLKIAMDMGWVATLVGGTAPAQLTLASEGGSGTELPAISIEVDDFELAHERARALGAPIEYGPVTEPWGLRRFFMRDPAGTLVNATTHTES